MAEVGAAGGREGSQPKVSFVECHYGSIDRIKIS
jgi:hypothetical protein